MKDLKVDIDEVKIDIREFIDFNKNNKEKYETESKQIENRYNVEVENETEYYTATMKGCDKFVFDNGEEYEINYQVGITSDWNGKDPEIDDVEYDFENEELEDELNDMLHDKATEFTSEYASVFENYYDSMEKFWVDKGYFDVEFEKFDMTIRGYGFVIKTSNWNQSSEDEFEIEVEDED